MALPRSSRSLYVHAYQSLVFNRVASRRAQSHGLRVLVGDLFADADGVPRSDLVTAAMAEGLKKNDSKREKATIGDDEEPTIGDDKKKTIGDDDDQKAAIDESDKPTIGDVLLPLPCHNMRFPCNEVSCGRHRGHMIMSVKI